MKSIALHNSTIQNACIKTWSPTNTVPSNKLLSVRTVTLNNI